MRRMILGLAVLTGACASGAAPPPPQGAADNPFVASRGTAPPPPVALPRDAPPPQGMAAGGFDFGAWRTADAAAYAQSFTRAMSARLTGMDTYVPLGPAANTVLPTEADIVRAATELCRAVQPSASPAATRPARRATER